MQSLASSPEPPRDCPECEETLRSQLEKALKWSDEDLVDRWDYIEHTLVEPLNECGGLCDLTLRTVLSFLNRIFRHKFYSLQCRAFVAICTENFVLQVADWVMGLVGKLAASAKTTTSISDISDLTLVHATYCKYAAKAYEMNCFSSIRSQEAVMQIIALIGESSREHDPSGVSPEFQELCHLVHKESTYPCGYYRDDLINPLVCKTEFVSVPDYLLWLFQSLKIDYELGLENDRDQIPLKIQAKTVILVLENRPHISVGLEFVSSDFFKMLEYVYKGNLMTGSLFIITQGDGLRIPVVTEQREVFGEGTVAVPISFDFEGKVKLKLNYTSVVEFTREFFEPYRKILTVLKRMTHEDIPLLSRIISLRSSPFKQKKETLHVRNQSTPTILNSEQNEAVNMCVSDPNRQAVHLIQGPPGTGKTFVALEIINELLKDVSYWDPSNDCQILIVSLKNDTVDNILLSLLAEDHRVVRLGGMSNHQCLKMEFNCSALKNFDAFHKHHIRKCSKEKITLSLTMKDVKSCLERLGKGILPLSDLTPILSSAEITYLQNHCIDDWLFEFEPLLESEVRIKHVSSIMNSPMINDDDFDNPPGFVSLRILEFRIKLLMMELKSMRYETNGLEKILVLSSAINLHYNIKALIEYCAKNPNHESISLESSRSLASLNKHERWQLYGRWFWTLESEYSQEMSALICKNQDYENRLDELFRSGRARIVTKNHTKVIGATTCAAAANRLFLENIKPKIVIVEEAAEVLEAHIVACLTQHTTSLILIGDHRQRAPHSASTLPHMHVSMFERLINLNQHSVVLTEQYRMRPEISRLVSAISYPSLVDGANVLEYCCVKGMKHNVFFLDCACDEDMVGSSFSNKLEAERVIGICDFLLAQGYEESQITILSPYSAQVICIQKMLEDNISTNEASAIRCCAVDGFQGEENDIIILSFVRSNSEMIIGFLNDVRRLTVALSRAKLGLYMVGNASVLGSSTLEAWKTIFSYLEENRLIGSDVPVYCPIHEVEAYLCCLTKDEFTSFCDQKCSEKLTCGHSCMYQCHVLRDGASHDSGYSCQVVGQNTCSKGHSYVRSCGSICEVPVLKDLACGHSLEVACGIEPKEVLCTVHVETNSKCGHSEILDCYQVQEAVKVCTQDCQNIASGCTYSHKCPNQCHEACVKTCVVPRERYLECGHCVTAPCYLDDVDVCCTAECGKLLPCGHLCETTCQTPCCCVGNAMFVCQYGHVNATDCRPPQIMHLICLSICGRILPECGHPCSEYCFKPCDECRCKEKVVFGLKCGHESLVPCHLTKSQEALYGRNGVSCDAPCCAALRCGHRCQGTCGGCSDGRYHKPCVKQCGRTLTCGHLCTAVCSNLMHVCDNPSCIRRKMEDVGKMISQEPSQASSTSRNSKVKRRPMNVFDVTRMINAHISERQPDQRTAIPANKRPELKKYEIYPLIKHKLADLILGPLHEKALRFSDSLFDSERAAYSLLRQLFTDFVTVFTSLHSMTIEKLKNLIFKIELAHWINHHLELLSTEPERCTIDKVLSALMKVWESQNYEFCWEQITQIFKLAAEWSETHEVRSPNFNFTREYVVPLTEHKTDWFAPQTFEDVFRMLDRK